jgi:HEPN domain-containing protein
MNRRTAEWVEKAEEEFLAAQSLAAPARPRRSIVSFHCQQAADKYVKALLQELGLAAPRTHDLEHLLDLL